MKGHALPRRRGSTHTRSCLGALGPITDICTALHPHSFLAWLPPTCRAAPALAIDEEHKLLCEPACAEELASKERVTTASGLQFQDLRVGTGPSPLVGFQVGEGELGATCLSLGGTVVPGKTCVWALGPARWWGSRWASVSWALVGDWVGTEISADGGPGG